MDIERKHHLELIRLPWTVWFYNRTGSGSPRENPGIKIQKNSMIFITDVVEKLTPDTQWRLCITPKGLHWVREDTMKVFVGAAVHQKYKDRICIK